MDILLTGSQSISHINHSSNQYVHMQVYIIFNFETYIRIFVMLICKGIYIRIYVYTFTNLNFSSIIYVTCSYSPRVYIYEISV